MSGLAIYRYRCADCGPFDLRRPMGEAAAAAACAACGGPARRVFTAPAVTSTRPLGRALAAQEASAHEPQVVSGAPAARRPAPPPPDPRHAKLPRP